MKESKIEWTHHTFNPWWGCLKVSAECTNCYAETLSNRWGFNIWGPAKTTDRRVFKDKHWNDVLKWDAEALETGIRKRVFCGSMCDVFEQHPSLDAERIKLWNLIWFTPNLDWLLLTKRPENILKMIPDLWKESKPPNVWLGTSVGINETKWRIAELIKCRSIARVLFLSMEPLLEEVQILDELSTNEIDWVIVGGESGRGKRPVNANWGRVIRENCKCHNVAFFMKQMDKVQEIPSDLMIREFPNQDIFV